jgi:tryptophan synthase beta chain
MQYAASPMAGILGKAYDLGKKITQKTIKGKGIQVKTAAPLLSFLHHLNLLETRVYPNHEKEILEAARIFLQTEGRLIAPESAYAIRAAIDEARVAKSRGESPVIVAGISGTTYLDFGEKQGYTDLG